MGFLDKIFKPKWKDVDWRVRIEGVKELKNQGTLANIAKNDDEWRVRRAAVERISDESVLVDIAKNDPVEYVRKEAVERISDESVLVDIAKNDPEEYVRKEAVERINDESVLVDIARNNYFDICNAAIGKISDESVLVDIAKNDDEWSVRRAAVERISDESVLVDIAKNDDEWSVRREAVWKISDESVLVDIAKNDPEERVRKEAFLKTNKYKNIDNFIKNSNDFYNDDLKEFEKYNYITSSIYNLENYQILLVKNEFSNNEFFTEWNDNTIYCQNKYVVGSHLRSKPVIEHEFRSVLYISEDLSSVDKITKRKYEYISKQISSKEELSPSTDDWVNVITTSSKFSNLRAIVIIGITDKITDLSEMFYGCKAETISFSNCDFSNVENTKGIFYGCDNLKTIYADETSRDSLITFVPESKKYIDNSTANNWYVCDDCGKRVNQIALHIHKKCPHCGSTNIREK